jgi:WD40 repeat protein
MGHTGRGCCICTEVNAFTSQRVVKAECPVTGHADKVTVVALSRDGKWVVSASWDTLVKIWNAATGALVSILECVLRVVR